MFVRRCYRSALVHRSVRYCGTVEQIQETKNYFFVQPIDACTVDRAGELSHHFHAPLLKVGENVPKMESCSVLQVTKDRLQLGYFMNRMWIGVGGNWNKY